MIAWIQSLPTAFWVGLILAMGRPCRGGVVAVGVESWAYQRGWRDREGLPSPAAELAPEPQVVAPSPLLAQRTVETVGQRQRRRATSDDSTMLMELPGITAEIQRIGLPTDTGLQRLVDGHRTVVR